MDKKEYHREYSRKWHQKHKQRRLLALKEREQNQKEYVRGLRERPCTDCGVEYEWFVMEFDHARGNKKFNISRTHRMGRFQLEEELKKCDVVCANCHRRRTHLRRVAPIDQLVESMAPEAM
jgi:hypothetical protein